MDILISADARDASGCKFILGLAVLAWVAYYVVVRLASAVAVKVPSKENFRPTPLLNSTTLLSLLHLFPKSHLHLFFWPRSCVPFLEQLKHNHTRQSTLYTRAAMSYGGGGYGGGRDGGYGGGGGGYSNG